MEGLRPPLHQRKFVRDVTEGRVGWGGILDRKIWRQKNGRRHRLHEFSRKGFDQEITEMTENGQGWRKGQHHVGSGKRMGNCRRTGRKSSALDLVRGRDVGMILACKQG